jgi:glutaconate CoA-transferase subunit B
MRIVSLHPGVTEQEVREKTGFELAVVDNLGTTPAPTQAQLDVIAELDPLNARSKQLKDNPSGDRR